MVLGMNLLSGIFEYEREREREREREKAEEKCTARNSTVCALGQKSRICSD
jgi:hypothetical protein